MVSIQARPGTAGLVLALPGLLAFIFAVVAENKKPGNTSDLVYDPVKDETKCNYHSDPSLALGILSIIFLFISAVLAAAAFYYPYHGKFVSPAILWRSQNLLVFTILSLIIFLVTEALLLWATILQFWHRSHNVHSGETTECPTAKAGLLGGAGFLALDATLFFLISLMLTANSRADYLDDEDEEDPKGSYGAVTTYPPPRLISPAAV